MARRGTTSDRDMAVGRRRRRWRAAVLGIVATATAVASPVAPAPAAPAAAAIDVSVAPTTGLVDGQTVGVTVHNFLSPLLIVQCDAAVGPSPTPDEIWAHCGNARGVEVTEQEMTFPYRVDEMLLSDTSESTIVCGDAPADCVVAVMASYGELFTSVPISVVPGPPARLAVEVVPPAGVGEHSQVVAYVAGGRTGRVRLALCGAAVTRSRDVERGPCLPAVDVPGGRVRVGIPFEPFRQFVGADGRAVRCDDAPGACVVAAGSRDGRQFASAPVTFSRNLSLSLSESRRLHEGQPIRAVAGGLRPGGRYTVIRCAMQDPVTPFYDCEREGAHPWIEASAQGTLTTVVRATDRIQTPDGRRRCRRYCSVALYEDGYGIDIVATYTMR